MAKKLYGIDLDGVCFFFAPAFCKWLENKTGLKAPEQEEITSYYWYECVDGLDKKEFWKEFHRFGEEGRGYRDLELIPGALDGLNRIIEAGHDIIYITNRPTYARDDTIESLKKNSFPSAQLIFAEGKKHPVINEIGVDVFIDDSPRTIKEITQFTDATIYCYDYPFNKDVDGEFIRVSNWNEFLTAEGIA